MFLTQAIEQISDGEETAMILTQQKHQLAQLTTHIVSTTHIL